MSTVLATQHSASAAHAAGQRVSAEGLMNGPVAGLNNNANNNPRIDGWAGV